MSDKTNPERNPQKIERIKDNIRAAACLVSLMMKWKKES